MKFLFMIIFSILLIGITPIFAETVHMVKIPSGAADPGSPYFWSVQSTGNTDGIVTILPNDTAVEKF